MVGAILVVKQKPGFIIRNLRNPPLAFEVYDRIKIIEFCKDSAAIIKGQNLRTGAEGFMYWSAFKRVGEREICRCKNQAF